MNGVEEVEVEHIEAHRAEDTPALGRVAEDIPTVAEDTPVVADTPAEDILQAEDIPPFRTPPEDNLYIHTHSKITNSQIPPGKRKIIIIN